ncbi:hypothetical protein GCM10022289_38020 [Pedobacter jeongneungensis]|uniref:Transmembrane protein n=1 Tax=Pedobacter jeongneungensis TaxID=947309 RepID=A0ABP8BN97_9SPHI
MIQLKFSKSGDRFNNSTITPFTINQFKQFIQLTFLTIQQSNNRTIHQFKQFIQLTFLTITNLTIAQLTNSNNLYN